MLLEQAIDGYLKGWVDSLPPKDADADWYRQRMKQPYVILESGTELWDVITPQANDLLAKSAELLLERTQEQRRVTYEAARRCILQAQLAHIEKSKKTGILSEHAVIAGAVRRITELQRQDGAYVIPVCFAPSAKETRFQIGPALILSKKQFDEDYGKAITTEIPDERFGVKAVREWTTYAQRYDHMIVVKINGHECEMAWRTARDVAEYVLNLVRMKFGFAHTDDVRTGQGLVLETSRASVYFDNQGKANLSLSYGPWASHLDDDWMDHFDEDFGSDATLLSSLASWMVSGEDPTSPVLERLRYANALIAEAYSEPHDRIRLVRLVAALEALAVLPREEKADSLAWRCAFAGGWGDCGRAVQIVDDVLHAYQIRNAVVHGDSPSNKQAVKAFYLLERHLARTSASSIFTQRCNASTVQATFAISAERSRRTSSISSGIRTRFGSSVVMTNASYRHPEVPKPRFRFRP